VSAISQKFHVECFTCFQCHKPIRSGLFHLENGEPYCDEGMIDVQASLLSVSYKLISAFTLAVHFCHLSVVVLSWFLVYSIIDVIDLHYVVFWAHFAADTF